MAASAGVTSELPETNQKYILFFNELALRLHRIGMPPKGIIVI
jgi:hypothetical protein